MKSIKELLQAAETQKSVDQDSDRADLDEYTVG